MKSGEYMLIGVMEPIVLDLDGRAAWRGQTNHSSPTTKSHCRKSRIASIPLFLRDGELKVRRTEGHCAVDGEVNRARAGVLFP